MGVSSTDDDEGGVIHLIGVGVAGAGGRDAGARSDCVKAKTAGGR